MAQVKEQIETPEKELSKIEITNLSDADFKTTVIRMLSKSIEYGKCITEGMKAMISEGREAGVQINNLEHKEEINSQPVPE